MAHTHKEISQHEWARYFAGIVRKDRTLWVRVESVTSETGDQALADRLPLVDISFETKGADSGAVQIILGREGDEITHRILNPSRVFAELDEMSGDLECLEIGEEDGKTLIFFEPLHDVLQPAPL